MTSKLLPVDPTETTIPRRGALRKAMQLGFALVGVGASVVRPSRAEADNSCTGASCCCLWYKDCAHTCSINGNGSIICPQNSYLKSWYCCYQYKTWRCSECKSAGSTCTDQTSSITCSRAVYLLQTCSSSNNGCPA